MERVCIFIDGSNLYHGLRNVHHGVRGTPHIDVQGLVNWLVGARKLVRTYYYNAALSTKHDAVKAQKQQRFFETLRRLPYFDVRLGRLEPRGNTFVEKGVDIAIAVDMLSMAVHDVYDTAILVSSDGDFAKAVSAVCDTGKHVEVACFEKAYHLKQAADKVIPLNAVTLKPLWISGSS